MSRVSSWLDEDYDKIPVEEAILGDSRVRGTTLRRPMVYGPGDPLHRFGYLKRMDDMRPTFCYRKTWPAWRGFRGYVENVAAAVVLATTNGKAAGRTYNLADPKAFEEQAWVRRIGRAAGWDGSVISIPPLKVNYRSEQHWEVSSERIRAELGLAEPGSLRGRIKPDH